MRTENLSTLKIHKLTQEQYERELAAGRIDENALYLTPDESISVDDVLSDISTNPVQNKVVNAAISNINNLVGDTAVSEQIADAVDGLATEAFVTNKISEAQLSGGNDVDLSGYATKDDLKNKADSSHTHRNLKANDGTGTVILGNETNSSGGSNYYFRPDAEGTNDVHYLGTSNHHWDKAFIDNLTLTNALPIDQGGTGATKAADVLTNLGITATATELNKLDGVTATTAELNYVDGVTSNIQTQLDNKSNSDHTHRDLIANNNNGVVRVGHEANSNNGTNYYLRPYSTSENDVYVLGSKDNHWDKAYIGDLTLTNPLSIENGGTGATKAADARANLNAASLGSNTFTASQAIPNNSRFKSNDTAGTEVNLIGISNNDNIVIGGSANPKPVYVYGEMQLDTDLAVKYGGTGASNPADARANLDITPMNIGAVPLQGESIPSNADLNNYTTVGVYRCPT